MTFLQKRFGKTHSHRYFVDSATNDAVCLCGKVQGSKKATPGKYNAISADSCTKVKTDSPSERLALAPSRESVAIHEKLAKSKHHRLSLRSWAQHLLWSIKLNFASDEGGFTGPKAHARMVYQCGTALGNSRSRDAEHIYTRRDPLTFFASSLTDTLRSGCSPITSVAAY